MPDYLQVAVGVVRNGLGQVLVALRDPKAAPCGLWEFPGGKLEPGEDARRALCRELEEEVGLVVEAAVPLLTVNHRQVGRPVRLNVFLVEAFAGVAVGRQGQALAWVPPADLGRYAFPAANRAIITAAQLPPYYAILDDGPWPLQRLQAILDRGVLLIQVRLKALSAPALARFIDEAYPLCQARQALLLVNSAVAGSAQVRADGLHLTCAHLLALNGRPAGCRWLAASCHNVGELRHAWRIGADFAVLAPVLPTLSHPGRQPLGWRAFARLAAQARLPVYALGGLELGDLATARNAGGQGVAAVRAFLG